MMTLTLKEKFALMDQSPEKKLLREKLNSLGNTPEKIRKSLNNMQIKGSTLDSKSCPIALFLEKSGFERPSVSPVLIAVGYGDLDICDVTPSDAVIRFLDSFDNEEYPELINDR